MRAGGAGRLTIAIALLVCAAAAAPLVSAAPAASAAKARRPAAPDLEGHALLRALAARDSARATWSRARWGGAFTEVRGAAARLDSVSARYRAALHDAPLPRSIAARSVPLWTSVALDLAEAGEWARAHDLLRGPLGSERSLLPLYARAAGRVLSPNAGLGALGWPPDRRDGPGQTTSAYRPARERARSDAELFVAATLADSSGLSRAARAARWRMLEETRPAAARVWSRYSLAQRLAGGGEPRLAMAVLSMGPSRTVRESLLLADLTAATGDSTVALRILIAGGTRSDLPTSDRYPAIRRAGGWMQGTLVDSVGQAEWMSVCRALGELGEPTLALRVLDGRKGIPPGAPGATERERLRASLLYRARRYEDAAAAYRTLLRRASGAAERAEFALGLARAKRATHDFAAADSAFTLAASLDSAGATGETAAWERAREWEDRKTPKESASVLDWARARMRPGALAAATRVHEALAWIRADSLAAAESTLARPETQDARIWFWRGWLASAARDSASAVSFFRRAWEADPWSYEGVRARELAGLPVDPTLGSPSARVKHPAREARSVSPDIRVLDLVGFKDLAQERLRACAMGEAEPQANGCIDALEEKGIFRTGRGSVDLDLRLRFPPAFAGPVFRAADEESLPPTFVWSIMRKESGYLPSARSRAGALGLLQLMPPTADRLAKRDVPEDSLVVPDLNVRLGARYLRQLVREFGDLRAVAAAYNSGEDAVRRWVAARSQVDDLWVEMIPYWETRDYVKQVYAAMRRYEAVYEAPPSR